MPNVALVPRAAASIGLLTAVVDGYPGENHRLETSTGGEPLEDGRNVTDHAVAREERLTLTGFVSDWNGGQRPAEAWEAIRTLQRTVTPVEVVTEWGTYPEMLIRRAEAPKTDRGMRFTMELHEVIRIGVTDLELPRDAVQNATAQSSFQATRTAAGALQADTAQATARVEQAAAAVGGNAALAEQAAQALGHARTAGDKLRQLNDLLAPVQDLSEYPVAEAADCVEQFRAAVQQTHQATQSLNQAVQDAGLSDAAQAATQAALTQAARTLRLANTLHADINQVGGQAVGVGRSGTVQRGRVSLEAEG